MRAHIVGGGFGGLAAAVCLIRNAGVPGRDITIYEAEERAGGGFFLAGNAGTGYHLPGSVFDEKFPCAFGLLQTISSAGDPSVSIKDALFSFNKRHPFRDRAHIIDRNGQKIHGPRFGLTLVDAFCFLRLVLTPEAALYGKRIDGLFSARFFSTEFWLCWASIMGTLPQHSAVEFRRYINCTLVLFPHLSDMTNVMRTPVNQYEFFIEPMVAWLRAAGVTLRTGAFVRDIGLDSIGQTYHRQSDRLRTEQCCDVGCRRTGRSRSRNHRIADRRHFGGIDDRGAAAAAKRTVLGALAAPGAAAPGFRQSRAVLR